jgi:hypothetical protein
MRKLHYAAIFTCLLALPCEALEWDSITIDCKLTPVSILNDDKGHLTAVPPTPKDAFLITFTGFDDKASRATKVGNNGSSPVLFFDAMGHVQLIEITEGKNVATTTITITGAEVNAVHTRHMAMFDGGTMSVYSGPCRVR